MQFVVSVVLRPAGGVVQFVLARPDGRGLCDSYVVVLSMLLVLSAEAGEDAAAAAAAVALVLAAEESTGDACIW